jgi:uncharacterized protein DUF29
MSTANELYKKDFHAWCNEQAEDLIAGRIHHLDLLNLAEEIKSVGNSERGKLESFLELLFMHILKWQYQPSLKCRSWRNTIKYSRKEIQWVLKKNPSLNSVLQETIEDSYRRARYQASKETGIDMDDFPEIMTFSYDSAMNQEF